MHFVRETSPLVLLGGQQSARQLLGIVPACRQLLVGSSMSQSIREDFANQFQALNDRIIPVVFAGQLPESDHAEGDALDVQRCGHPCLQAELREKVLVTSGCFGQQG